MKRGFHYLQQTQNADGGWGYYPGKMSFSEPTCLAALALGNSKAYELNVQNGLSWLIGQQLENGGFKTTSDDDCASWVTSLAVIALTALDRHTHQRDMGTSWLINKHGYSLSGGKRIKLNTKARGWPWLEGASSWVEPTAYAVIALKLAMVKSTFPGRTSCIQRIENAEGLFYDTVCEGGGWNYGNNLVLGVNLRPYLPTTALTLIALQGSEDDKSSQNAVRQSLNYMKKAVKTELSALSTALSILSLDIYGEETVDLCHALHSLQKGNGSWEDNAHLTALSLLALQTQEGRNPFLIKRKVV